MKVLFSGGGTGGSVSPLLAIFEQLKKQQPEVQCLWLATKNGVEKKLIEPYGLPIIEISSGKLRRYFSWQNFIDPFLILAGLVQSFFILKKFKPQIVITAGGFVAVPVAWAAKFLKIPVIVHQQDVVPGLANKLMASSAQVISVTFEKSLNDFPKSKVVLTGNPVRSDIFLGDKQKAINKFNLHGSLPVVLVYGGGTGAASLNNLVIASVEALTKFCQVIHITGGKAENKNITNYHQVQFLSSGLGDVYAACDLVVSRAGMSSLSELSALGKPAVLIPLPNSHQELNANEFFKLGGAAVLDQKNLIPQDFALAIMQLLNDKAELANLSRNIKKVIPAGAAEKILKTFL